MVTDRVEEKAQDQVVREDGRKTLADRLKTKRDTGADTTPHLIIEARAGTGKTTTLIESLKLLKGLPSDIVPSPQQQAIFDAVCLSKGKAQTVGFVAFNKSIAEELKRRVPAGCDAMTMHSLGFSSVKRAFGNVKVNSYRVQDVVSELLERDIRELRRTKPVLVKATEELVGLCKMNLSHLDPCGNSMKPGDPDWNETLRDLASYYDVDLNSSQEEVFSLVPRVLERCKDVARDNCVDFNDMVWIPVALGLNVQKYDVLLCDECQDLSKVQQALAKMSGRRLILCGDPKQAIYGFAGADSESMKRMAEELSECFGVPRSRSVLQAIYAAQKIDPPVSVRGCVTLPLTVTRRCGKAIVKEAQRIVPDFEAHESNCDGAIRHGLKYKDDEKEAKDGAAQSNYRGYVQDGDMILCRCNAPLVSQCFKFLKAGRKAVIQGRDVGQGLISTINKMKCDDVSQLLVKLEDWLHKEQTKENSKRNPSDTRLIALQDRHDCLIAFCEDQTTVAGVVAKIESVFTDDKNGTGIRLSSIHKAKGLENKRVFLLEPEGATVPHPMAKSKWQVEQEWNCRYIAITRAIEELIYVS